MLVDLTGKNSTTNDGSLIPAKKVLKLVEY